MSPSALVRQHRNYVATIKWDITCVSGTDIYQQSSHPTVGSQQSMTVKTVKIDVYKRQDEPGNAGTQRATEYGGITHTGIVQEQTGHRPHCHGYVVGAVSYTHLSPFQVLNQMKPFWS